MRMNSQASGPLAGAALPSSLMYPPRVTRVSANMLVAILLFSAFAMTLAPWVQTAFGSGQVIAFTPLEREQTIKAPLSGRVLSWKVREGQAVKAGDLLIELSDNDPDLIARLESERRANQARIEATDIGISSLESQIKSLEQMRTLTLDSAEAKIRMAQNKLIATRRKFEANQAADRTAKLQFDRADSLKERGLIATKEMELSELKRFKASIDVATSKAEIEEARSYVLAMQAERLSKGADIDAKIAKAQSELQTKRADRAKYSAELLKIETNIARQANMKVIAPRDGVIRSFLVQQGGEYVKAGEPLAVLVPDTARRAIEIWVDGNDAPLVFPGRHARVQFEGWPAVQFSGWPSVAVGTFGAQVAFMDANATKNGKFRVVLVPDDGEAWPDGRYLRQGARVNAWVLLNEVRLGYEVWRQLNGFPPALDQPADDSAKSKKSKSDDDEPVYGEDKK